MKPILILLIVLVGFAAVLIGRDSTTARSVKAFNSSIASAQQKPTIIEVATHPELIPDRAAYSVLFRLIANRRTPEEKSRIRA